ncbi:hypothetical protein CUMW_221300, partial [Citrus unshiu]
ELRKEKQNKIKNCVLEEGNKGNDVVMVMKERDEELALFLEMRRREKEKTNLLLPLNSDNHNAPSGTVLFGTNDGGSPISKIVSSVPIRKTAAENFLNSESENDKSDYDWLLTPPGTPLFPSLEMESQKAKLNQMEMPNARPTALKTRLANVQEDPASRGSVLSKNPNLPSRVNSSSTGDNRPSSSGGRTSMKNSAPSRGTSPTVKSRPWKPSEMPGFSLDAPPNLRTSLPERPSSASRGRPGAPSAQSPSVEAGSKGRRRQQSCSPSRVRTSNGNGGCITSARRVNASDGDDVNPVVIGTKMVERVVNMRKLAPPKQENHSTHYTSAGKSSSSLDSSGFGRTLSKKSLDMALRHMDIRRSINSGSLRPLMTNIPASSMYSVRSGSIKSRTVSVTDSPLATSSNASSEPSVNNNPFILDGNELDDIHDFGSERGNSSPVSQHSSR